MVIKPVHIKRGDTQPYYYGKLVNANRSPIDITALTITFTMVNYTTGAKKVDAKEVAKTTPTEGEFRYQWASGDTDTSGRYWVYVDFGEYQLPVQPKMAQVIIHD